MGGSYHNLAALAEAKFSDARQAGMPSRLGASAQSGSAVSLDSASGRNRRGCRLSPSQQEAMQLPGGMLDMLGLPM
jgi:hypothetical protein